MNKLLATLIAGFFAAGAFAQIAPATPAKPEVKAEVKADAKAVKEDKKADVKAAKEVKKDGKPEAKAEVAKADKPATVTK